MQDCSVLLLGASVRALAQSCGRAGFACYGADLFADCDTRQIGNVERVDIYPEGLHNTADSLPPTSWMYTGGLENHPALVDQVSQRHTLWGNPGDVLRRVRDPMHLQQTLRAVGLNFPTTTLQAPATMSGRWIRKPLRSCGGTDVVLDQDLDRRTFSQGSNVYWQAFVPGQPVAAIYIGNGRTANLIGVTGQIVGARWTGAAAFQYAGSVGPLALSRRLNDGLERLGDTLVDEFRLQGVFGVDGVLGDANFWTVEVNPRYTASVEVLERAGAGAIVREHAAVFGQPMEETKSTQYRADNPTMTLHGKAIIFAKRDVQIDDSFPGFVDQLNAGIPEPAIADIPAPGSEIKAGQPIATIFAQGETSQEVNDRLMERAAQLRAAIREESIEPPTES